MPYAPTLAARLRLYAAFLAAGPDRKTAAQIAEALAAIAAELENPPELEFPQFPPPLPRQTRNTLR
jgi:hypothetical protein